MRYMSMHIYFIFYLDACPVVGPGKLALWPQFECPFNSFFINQ
jgi:hypothetical protein